MNPEGSFNLKAITLRLHPFKYFLLLAFFFCSGLVLAEDSMEEITDQLQIGSEWGKSIPSLEDKSKTPGIGFIGEFKTATAFLIKSESNRFFMGTNSHVIVNDHSSLITPMQVYRDDPTLACHNRDSYDSPVAKVRFPNISKDFPCKQLIGIWPNIDFAIFRIEVDEQSVDLFRGKGINIDFQIGSKFELGTLLTVYGFGHFLNPGKEDLSLMKSEDEDCRVFSPYNEIALKKDPDQFSPGKVEVWSFVHGCEIFWGDSGSPIFDREGNLAESKYGRESSLRKRNYSVGNFS